MGKLQNLIDKTDMIAWHRCVIGEAGDGLAPDYSGNGRTASAATNKPVIYMNTGLNGQPGWYFDGTKNPLVYTGAVAVKHAFMVASFDESVFTSNRGLLSGPTSGDVFTSNLSGDTFFDFSGGAVEQDYKKNDLLYADNNMKAPVGGVPAVIELTHTLGIPMDGIQIGQQKTDTTRRHKGFFWEQMLFSSIRPDYVRAAILEYFAMEFQIWRQVASGLDVFPFQPDSAISITADKTVIGSIAVSGAYKGRIKSTAKDTIDFSFTDRWTEERDAARAFWDSKHPGTHFIFRNDGFSPARDAELRFTSGFGNRMENYQHNYGFQAVQV